MSNLTTKECYNEQFFSLNYNAYNASPKEVEFMAHHPPLLFHFFINLHIRATYKLKV